MTVPELILRDFLLRACRFHLRHLTLSMANYQSILSLLLGLGIALTIFCIGFVKLLRIVQFKRKSEQTTGTIIQFHRIGFENPTEDDQVKDFPVIQFTTHSGERQTHTYFVSSWSYAIGDRVKVHYNPLKPIDFIIDDLISGLMPCLLTIGGILLFILLLMVY